MNEMGARLLARSKLQHNSGRCVDHQRYQMSSGGSFASTKPTTGISLWPEKSGVPAYRKMGQSEYSIQTNISSGPFVSSFVSPGKKDCPAR